jgi:hypothetical protein
MSSLGFFFSCYKEKKAVEYSLSELVKHYPDNPIYLVSDGGEDFSHLESQFNNIKTTLEEDTMSETFKITAGSSGCDKRVGNYAEDYYQDVIKKCTLAVLNRLEKAIDYCKTDYILMMDPDTLVRGKLNIPEGVKLLGSKINQGLPKGLKNILARVEGAKVIDHWGATPAIFETKTFMKSWEMFKETPELLDMLAKEFYAIYAHDVLLPIIFALVGEEETFNPDIIECSRNPFWEVCPNPLVHQFKRYYDK